MEILTINAREILDSRGNPTVEVDVILRDGTVGRASVPSGASTGKREALELRDGDRKRYSGMGVLKVISNIKELIAPAIKGINVFKQREIDRIMIEADGTENKRRIGANAIIGVSVAVAKAAANYLKIPLYRYVGGVSGRVLPVPMMNIINGGLHADNNFDIQEFMIVPYGAKSFSDAIRMGSEVFHKLKGILRKKGYSTSVGDEGGFAPSLKAHEEAFDLICQAIKVAGYEPGVDIGLAIDVAASNLYEKGKYIFKKSTGKEYGNDEIIELYANWVNQYPIISIEDGMSEDDWEGWKKLTESMSDTVQIVGDDVFVTNPTLLSKGIEEGVANAVLIKVNQIGTISETLDVIEIARSAGYTVIVSHRSGETEDTFISDISVAVNAGQIKAGSISRTDRVSKYNQLIRIEEELGKEGIYRGKEVYGKRLIRKG